jgi:hypothetical protein
MFRALKTLGGQPRNSEGGLVVDIAAQSGNATPIINDRLLLSNRLASYSMKKSEGPQIIITLSPNPDEARQIIAKLSEIFRPDSATMLQFFGTLLGNLVLLQTPGNKSTDPKDYVRKLKTIRVDKDEPPESLRELIQKFIDESGISEDKRVLLTDESYLDLLQRIEAGAISAVGPSGPADQEVLF